METVHTLQERLVERRSELRKTRKSHPGSLLSLAGLREAKKEPKGSAQKSSLGETKLVRPHLRLKPMQNALTQQGKSCTAIPHALNELDPAHLPFCLPVVMGVR